MDNNPSDPSLANCLLCPRGCCVDRIAGVRGFCGETGALRIASASIHRGEEPPITGKGGSGTIFISGCNLGCVFCQNYQISLGNQISTYAVQGRAVSLEEFAAICRTLEEQGAENINIVTGSHAVPAIVRGIALARNGGLTIPVLWNSSAYETVETLELLRDTVDVFLPDLKTLDSNLADRFFHATDYPGYAAAAIEWMMQCRALSAWNAVPETATQSEKPPVLRSGVIIRHLILPGYLESTRKVLRWFAEHAQDRALLSLMTQYTPVGAPANGAPGRFLNEDEYNTVLRWLDEFGIEDGFYQELVTGSDWLPDFSRRNPFSSDLSVPVWHWRESPAAPPNGIKQDIFVEFVPRNVEK